LTLQNTTVIIELHENGVHKSYWVSPGSGSGKSNHLACQRETLPGTPVPPLADAASSACNALSGSFIIGRLLGLAVNGAPNSPNGTFGYCGNPDADIPPAPPPPPPAVPPLEKWKLNDPWLPPPPVGGRPVALPPLASALLAGCWSTAWDKVEEMESIEGPKNIPGGEDSSASIPDGTRPSLKCSRISGAGGARSPSHQAPSSPALSRPHSRSQHQGPRPQRRCSRKEESNSGCSSGSRSRVMRPLGRIGVVNAVGQS